jgi:hypothetical protein
MDALLLHHLSRQFDQEIASRQTVEMPNGLHGYYGQANSRRYGFLMQFMKRFAILFVLGKGLSRIRVQTSDDQFAHAQEPRLLSR